MDFRCGNAHDRWMHNCLDRKGLINIWDLPGIREEDTYVTPDFTVKSWIDHLCCSEGMAVDVGSMCVHKVTTNNSWHRPVSAVIDVSDELRRDDVRTVPSSVYTEPPVAWHRVTDNHLGHYHDILSKMLLQIHLPPAIFCQDLECKDIARQNQISELCDDISTCCIEAGSKCLPRKKSKHHIKLGWAHDVQPCKEASVMWQNIWTEHGEPEEGEVF